jgi:hypothetical protein
VKTQLYLYRFYIFLPLIQRQKGLYTHITYALRLTDYGMRIIPVPPKTEKLELTNKIQLRIFQFTKQI